MWWPQLLRSPGCGTWDAHWVLCTYHLMLLRADRSSVCLVYAPASSVCWVSCRDKIVAYSYGFGQIGSCSSFHEFWVSWKYPRLSITLGLYAWSKCKKWKHVQTSRYLSPTRKVRRSDHANTTYSHYSPKIFCLAENSNSWTCVWISIVDIRRYLSTISYSSSPKYSSGSDLFVLATSHQYSLQHSILLYHKRLLFSVFLVLATVLKRIRATESS